jgi:mannose-6-phosphate isomerase-like protein (cupin superfamily)
VRRAIDMAVEIIDLRQLAYEEKRRKVVFNTQRLHAWVHYYANPGERDDMHCHNADQTFYVIEGECTMHFPDGGKAVMKPGMAATITGGSFYQLENSGDGPMIMMGNRSGPSEAIQHINYELRKDIRNSAKRSWSAPISPIWPCRREVENTRFANAQSPWRRRA